MTLTCEKVQTAIKRLQSFEPDVGYEVGYSGGKDSDVIKILANLANVNHIIVHNLTTVDAPETVRYIKSQGDVIIKRPELSMWQLIPKKLMPPTRLARYCCQVLKERPTQGQRILVTGVRWAESARRAESADVVKILNKPKTTQRLAEELNADYRVTRQQGIALNTDNTANRRLVEMCYRTRRTMVNPIVDWEDSEVWEFLNHFDCKSNPLYQCGYHRIGCVGCPLGGRRNMLKEFARYPKYRRNYISAFERMIKERRKRNLSTRLCWQTGEDVFNWWVGIDANQLAFNFDKED